MPTPVTVSRRRLRFETLDEVVAECERLAAGDVRTVGQWTYPEILEHLAQGIDALYDGFGFRAAWWVRLARPVIRWKVFRSMPAGFRLPPEAVSLFPHRSVETTAALDHLRRSMARLETEPHRHPHPALGRLTREEARLLTLRHCELHLGFVLPGAEACEPPRR